LALQQQLAVRTKKCLAIIISDSFGRPWRRGTVGIALGVAGLPSVIDWRGQPDLFGRKLEVTETGFADEIAAAASLVQGQAAEATPIVLVRGLSWTAPEAPGAAIVRPPEHDLFR
jgi:coenzyme F420-0:L-glutamate ligase/coenzyme F420-1:gamma-L-glutamate ligase